jgi:tellurite resistance protein TerC
MSDEQAAERLPWSHPYRIVRRLVVAVVGLTLVALGLALLVLPGPAFVVIPTGLAVLAIEFGWARRLLRRLREELGAASQPKTPESRSTPTGQ